MLMMLCTRTRHSVNSEFVRGENADALVETLSASRPYVRPPCTPQSRRLCSQTQYSVLSTQCAISPCPTIHHRLCFFSPTISSVTFPAFPFLSSPGRCIHSPSCPDFFDFSPRCAYFEAFSVVVVPPYAFSRVLPVDLVQGIL